MKKHILVTVLFIALALTGCSGQEFSQESVTEEVIVEASNLTNEEDSAIVESTEATETTEQTKETTSIEVEETKPSTSIMEEKLELVITEDDRIAEILNESGTYTDCVGNTCQYTYQIPQFNAESESAKVLNSRIVQELGEVIEIEYEVMAGEVSLDCPSVTYEVFEYGDVVSFLVAIDYETDFVDYFAYSYDFAGNKEVTNKELLALNEMTEEMFVEEACRQATEDFIEWAKVAYPDMTKEDREWVIAESVAATTADLPMYYDSEGTLHAYVPLASVAGASWYYSLYQF